MATLQEVIHHEINRAMTRQTGIKAAIITAYDPNRHAIKAMLKPDEIETGWFPMALAHVGNNFGIVAGPEIGDQIAVGFLGHDLESPVHLGRLHSDHERPPVAESGEIVIKTGSGVTLKIDKSGNVSLDADGHSVTVNSKNIHLTGDSLHFTGDVDFGGGYLKHMGHDVGNTHKHTDVTPGGSLTGVPQ